MNRLLIPNGFAFLLATAGIPLCVFFSGCLYPSSGSDSDIGADWDAGSVAETGTDLDTGIGSDSGTAAEVEPILDAAASEARLDSCSDSAETVESGPQTDTGSAHDVESSACPSIVGVTIDLQSEQTDTTPGYTARLTGANDDLHGAGVFVAPVFQQTPVDLDADGLHDLVIGVVLDDTETPDGSILDNAGRVYLFRNDGLGFSGDYVWDDSVAASTGSIVRGLETDANTGATVLVGDIDSDGCQDLFFNAPGGQGEVFVIYGEVDDRPSTPSCSFPESVELNDATRVSRLPFTGDTSDDAGFGELIGLTDFNDDGSLDFIIGGPVVMDRECHLSGSFRRDCEYALFGYEGPELPSAWDEYSFAFVTTYDFGRFAVADMDDNGCPDILLNSSRASMDAQGEYDYVSSGAYLLFNERAEDGQCAAFESNGQTLWEMSEDLVDTWNSGTGIATVRFFSSDENDSGTASQRGLDVGDFDGDGIDDIAFGIKWGSTHADMAGGLFIVYGPVTDLGDFDLATNADAKFEAPATNVGDKLGIEVTLAGDPNGDGIMDIGVGTQANYVVYTYIIFGRARRWSGTHVLEVSDDITLVIGPAFDRSGASSRVRPWGDNNLDGVVDLAFISGYDPSGARRGYVYVVEGCSE